MYMKTGWLKVIKPGYTLVHAENVKKAKENTPMLAMKMEHGMAPLKLFLRLELLRCKLEGT